MKATGIIRSMDKLGRIVIPSELHDTLHIHAGEQLEILIGEFGEIIFRKYSPLNIWRFISEKCVSALYQKSGHPVLICDRDQVVAVAGVDEKEIQGRRISDTLDILMEQHEPFGGEAVRPVTGMEQSVIAGAVVLSAGHIIGSIMLLSEDSFESAAEDDKQLVSTAADFLSNMLESRHDRSCIIVIEN